MAANCIFGDVTLAKGFVAIAVVALWHYVNAWISFRSKPLDELLEDNRRMVALLDKRQYNVSYREFSGGHNYTAWRNDVWRGLEEMFPLAPR